MERKRHFSAMDSANNAERITFALKSVAAAAAPASPAEAAPAAPAKRENKGAFKPGHDPRRLERPKSHGPNTFTRDIKRGIVDAAAKHGSDGRGKDGLTGYLFHLAKKHPKAFAGLIGKTIPLQVAGNVGQYIGTVNVISVPVDHYLKAEDIARMQPPALIDGTAEDDGIADDTAEIPEQE
jgi:hypothetical protein